MIYPLLILWFVVAFCILIESRNIRLIIYLCVFSALSSFAFFLLGSPDAAMAEAAIGAFTTIFFIICFEKYSELKLDKKELPEELAETSIFRNLVKYIPQMILCIVLFFLFINFIPTGEPNTYLKDLYLLNFMDNVGGENAVTAIYLGYRVYDTLFEALVLVIAVVAVVHMSYTDATFVKKGRPSFVGRYMLVVSVLRLICAVILLYGIYLIFNGHISAGGGFQGGLFIAAFFVCRYLIYDIYDLPIKKVFRMEEFIFFSIVLVALFVVFLGSMQDQSPFLQEVYMIGMNAMIGLKVACGFLILFYRYIAIERR